MLRRNRPPGPRPFWNRLAWLVAAVLGLALASVEMRHRRVALGNGAGSDAPIWIWRDHDLRHVQAAAFYAVKEFELVEAPSEAEVRVLGDAEYLLTLNGARIGSNRFASGATLDRYRIDRWLAPGRNRLVIEMRSPSGAGGLWFELSAGGQQLVRSDGSWTIYESKWKGLFGERPMPPGERPRLLGRSPLGRWGSPGPGPERPVFENALAAAKPIAARHFRVQATDAPWQRAARRGRRPPSMGPLVEFDFGVERIGYLQLSYREGAGQRPEARAGAVLLAFGNEPIGEAPWSADGIFYPIPGAELYQDSTLRRFRYVAVAGLPGLFRAEVLAISDLSWPALAPRSESAVGILGVRPPRSSAPVEHEIWRKLERPAGGIVWEKRQGLARDRG